MAKNKKKVAKISLFAHEMELTRMERINKRMIIGCVIDTFITALTLVMVIENSRKR